MRHPNRLPTCGRKQAQGGAALYVALIMLILMALLGLIGMQIASMQERMAANYLRADQAFQNAEALVRQVESQVKAANGAYAVDSSAASFDALNWAGTQTDGTAKYVRRITSASNGSGIGLGATVPFSTAGSAYEVTALSTDTGDAGTAAASAVIQTVYLP
ncbi:pilus assembly PilX family protein [Xanthomonas massiliensis]|uniref:pilus assembly PilX family protein n=1 Tax=Xanthomonas massiliensis TaxID=1720302 RepID=UPI00098E8C79|nr:PilX N-terminal domain-containing pilus assembly protein [Xanthomonas massiliensis]